MIPKQPTKPFLFTTLDEEIITDALAPFHLLTAVQITAIIRPGKPGNLTKVQTRLARLTGKKYLMADPLETKRGQRPYLYTLGIKGKRLLEERGHEVLIYFEPSEFEHRTYKRLHTLELNNFLIQAATLHTFEPRLTFSDMQHELLFERRPLTYQDEATGTRTIIRPDALFALHLKQEAGPDRHYHCWVELDRNTESDEKLKRKFASMYDFYARGFLADHFGQGPVLVFFATTAGIERVEHLRKLFRQAFPELNPHSAKNQMFKFARLPPLTQAQPPPLTVFCTPFWSTAHGPPEQLQTIITL